MPAWDKLDAVESLIEERGYRSPGLATILIMINDEKRYLTAFEPDELLPESDEVPTRSSAD